MKCDYIILQFHSVSPIHPPYRFTPSLCVSPVNTVGVSSSFGTEIQIVLSWGFAVVVFIIVHNVSDNLHSSKMVVSSIMLIISDW